MIAENVKNLIGKKFKDDFDKWISDLDEMGYNTYYKVLNAKDFGVPQNRERVFVVSIRKDINNSNFEFPIGNDKGIRLKDILEDKVDEKYYLGKTRDFFIQNSLDMEAKGNGFRFKPHIKNKANIAQTITTRAGSRMDDNYIIDELDWFEDKLEFNENNLIKLGYIGNKDSQSSRVYSADGVSATIASNGGGLGAKTGLYLDENSNKPRLVGGIGELNFGKQFRQGNRVYDADAIAMCLNASPVGNAGGNSYLYKVDYKIRKLTPKECFRLMGFTDIDFLKVKNKLNETFYKGKDRSDSQMYKQAGNSIVVQVIEELFKPLFSEYINQK